MWGYVNGAPIKFKNIDEDYVTLIDAWKTNNAKLLLRLTILLNNQ